MLTLHLKSRQVMVSRNFFQHINFLCSTGIESPENRTLTFLSAGSREESITITLVDDAIVENDERIILRLSSQDSSVDIDNSTSLLLIEDNDCK